MIWRVTQILSHHYLLPMFFTCCTADSFLMSLWRRRPCASWIRYKIFGNTRGLWQTRETFFLVLIYFNNCFQYLWQYFHLFLPAKTISFGSRENYNKLVDFSLMGSVCLSNPKFYLKECSKKYKKTSCICNPRVFFRLEFQVLPLCTRTQVSRQVISKIIKYFDRYFWKAEPQATEQKKDTW